ncbi:MAG: heme exporter protein CcmD [Alphaproteobacteria bacterium]|nr:heme exporter protein CcmD [Alphaproteobacteria bacterium]MDE2111026.1 heme exporter protein CcmD [Alphaproteobacteria bacterium]MDE2493813.1 heme exporter protein CcmD [Alphaproteobacteria bacterium]
MSDFWSEGGYAFFVWTSYAVSLIGLGVMAGFTLNAYRKAKQALARLEGKE